MGKMTRRKFMELTGAAAVVAGTSSLTGCAMPEEIICELEEEIEIENGKMAFIAALSFADEEDESVVIVFAMMFDPTQGKEILVRARDFQLKLNDAKAGSVSLYVDKQPGFYLDDQGYTVTEKKGLLVFAEFPREKWYDKENLVTVKFFCGQKCYVAMADHLEGFAGS